MSHRSKTSGNAPIFSATNVLNAVGSELAAIKLADGLTYNDIAEVLGKSEDQAAKYCLGTAEMGVVAYANAKRQWNGRFTGALDRLCFENSGANHDSDRTAQNKVLRAAFELSEALEGDDDISAADVRKCRPSIEAAIDALRAQLAKIEPPRAVA